MNILKNIYSLMGGSYLTSDYNPQLPRNMASISYYVRDHDSNNFQLQSSLTQNGPDKEIAKSYDTDHLPPDQPTSLLAQSVHAQKTLSARQYITQEQQEPQVVTCIPIHTTGGQIRGVIQHRHPVLATKHVSQFAEEKIALADYYVRALSPLLNKNPIAAKQLRNDLSTTTHSLRFLSGLKDHWQQAIRKWSMETYEHTVRVSELCELMAHQINNANSGTMSMINIPPKELELFKLSAELHDFGKLYTPLAILESGVPLPGGKYELNKSEREIMARHVQDAYDVLDLEGCKTICKIRDICGAHHLHANGRGGYPEEIRKNLNDKGGIPFEAKLLSIADIFESLTADRGYREGLGLPLSETLGTMQLLTDKGILDAQLLRFCVESGIFNTFAKNHDHFALYDHELLNQLSYASADIAKAQQEKNHVCAEIGLPESQVEAIIKMGEKKALKLLTNPGAPQTSQACAAIFSMKKKLIQHLASTNTHGDISNDMYAYKLLQITQEKAQELEQTKQYITQQIWGDTPHGTEVPYPTAKIENLAMDAITYKRAQLELWNNKSPSPTKNTEDINIQKLGTTLKKIEAQKVTQIQESLLKHIPEQPLSPATRFTLFQTRHHASAADTSIAAAR